MIKRIFSLLVVLALLFVFPISETFVKASEPFIGTSGDYEYIVENGNASIIEYLGEGGEIEIPNIIDGYQVDGIGYTYGRTKLHMENVTSVIIPEGVTFIGQAVFYNCGQLTSVTIPESVTLICEEAFARTSLTSLEMPGGVKHIEETAFGSCKSITSLKLSEGLETIGIGAFSGCSSLTSVTIPKSVIKIETAAFDACPNLQDIIVLSSETEISEEPIYGPKMSYVIAEGPAFTNKEASSIYAYSNSKAQTFAANNAINFTPLAHVQLNGETLEFDVPPIIENNRVLVPARKILETLGAAIKWNGETKTVTAETAQSQMRMQIGNKIMQLNGENRELDTAPIIFFDRTLVPVRAVSESFGATVDWDGETQTVVINTK